MVEDLDFNEIVGTQNLIVTVRAINAVDDEEVTLHLHAVAVDAVLYHLAVVIKHLMEDESDSAMIGFSDLFHQYHPTWFVM